jgi:hypothetical protein
MKEFVMDIRGVSRRFGAVALVVGPLALVASSLFEVTGDDDSVATSLTKIARHQGEQRFLIVADLIAAFMLPAMVYLMRLSRRGAPRAAIVGGAVAFVGWLGGLVSLGGSDVLLYHAARLPDRSIAVSLVKSVVNDPGFVGPEAVFILGHLIGMLILGFALWRSRVMPAWVAGLVGIGPIVHLVVHDLSGAIDAAAYGLVAVGTIACAVTLLRTSDEDWDLPAKASVRPNSSALTVDTQLPISR